MDNTLKYFNISWCAVYIVCGWKDLNGPESSRTWVKAVVKRRTLYTDLNIVICMNCNNAAIV